MFVWNCWGVIDELAIGERFRLMAPELNERQRRLWAASEARAAGRGGITATARARGMAIDTVRKGIAELESGERLEVGRVRRPGGGRKSLLERDPTILDDIERLVDRHSRGDPESLLRWTAKSVRQIAGALREMGHEVHFTSVATFMRLLGYSLQANVKTKEGASHPDRDAQFQHINATATAAVAAGWPVISVDTNPRPTLPHIVAGRGAASPTTDAEQTAELADAARRLKALRERRARLANVPSAKPAGPPEDLRPFIVRQIPGLG